MRATLRRSCDACAKAKHRCDLRTPRCSRCTKRKASCVYANAPLTSSPDAEDAGCSESSGMSTPVARGDEAAASGVGNEVALLSRPDASFDPFDSYPPTRLPRIHVQRLIHNFLSNIAFQYYPLDLNLASNPFVVSWWPLALEDPALFHVSLQTASLDEELRAQNGFPISSLLMADSVSLVRQKIEDSSLAFQDGTLNSVVTLAAIEHGKGNVQTTRMHIDGVKRMVGVRGGINQLKRSSPLTARMVSWVSMLVTGVPQFDTQDDGGFGGGIGPILQWQLASTNPDSQQRTLDELEVDPILSDILARLRNIFHEPQLSRLTSTELHDLTCFVVHRLLLLPPFLLADSKPSAISECLRYTTVLYMLIIHGTTYYSHTDLANSMIHQLKSHLQMLAQTRFVDGPLGVWILSIGMVAATRSADRQWFANQAYTAAMSLGLQTWEDVLMRLESIFWMRPQEGELFRQRWGKVLDVMEK
ncbi:hypothetical protein AK830_g9841 [Neonectria ditissima]|uniref:Zn(2)-C6 fungal-type domain-containing protein n=1 Tax=Neonectria ditissima TaxID=78410 RepID=A0A0P7B8D0_9HYPO|nr:hypothetical protein AK830_g9841 [Neonectria ditissima]